MYKPQHTKTEILKTMVTQWHFYRCQYTLYTGEGKDDRNAERKATEAKAGELAIWYCIASNFGAYTDTELEAKLAAYED